MERHDDELERFFARDPLMLPIYRILEDRILAEVGADVLIRVQKTQITFSDRRVFGCASLPIRRKRDWPRHCLMVTFGLAHRVDAPRIAVATEPYPNRWTHHVLVERPDEIDDELMAWMREAHAFALSKGGAGRSPA